MSKRNELLTSQKTLMDYFSNSPLMKSKSEDEDSDDATQEMDDEFTDAKPHPKANPSTSKPFPSFDATKWLSSFNDASRSRNSYKLRSLRVDIMNVTWYK